MEALEFFNKTIQICKERDGECFGSYEDNLSECPAHHFCLELATSIRYCDLTEIDIDKINETIKKVEEWKSQ